MDIKTQCVTSLAVLVYVINMSGVAAMPCPEAMQLDCKSESELGCKGGVIESSNACAFCTVCAKVEDERCGGPWGVYGQCDEGLECHKTKPPGSGRWPWEPRHYVGVCRKINWTHVCSLPSKKGRNCLIMWFKKYFYNAEKGACERFLYGGCEGNLNNFETLQECMKWCGGPKVSKPESLEFLPRRSGQDPLFGQDVQQLAKVHNL